MFRAPAAIVDPDIESDEQKENPTPRWRAPHVLVATAGFLLFAVAVLIRHTALLEPDDYAYRAAIAALRRGHVWLSTAQYNSLSSSLGGIQQWHHLASGRWISEKNPGYPFFAVGFYVVGLLRLAPLFYGALAGLGLYFGASAWLGRWAGVTATWLYFFSGAALTFAWRDTMPSFTDASLIAAGFGALLWVLLRSDVSERRRRWVGLASFLALEGAVFIRYTNVAELVVAAVAVLAVRRAARISWRTMQWWIASVVLFGLFVLGFNQWAYGHATSTGYSAGEISFSLASFWPNLLHMPGDLARALPVWLVALGAVVGIAVRSWRHRRPGDEGFATARRDLVVGGGLVLGWLAMWLLYFTYTWTVNMAGGGGGGGVVHVVRFYLPAMGPIALLATWLVVRLRRVAGPALIALLVVLAFASYGAMSSSNPAGPGGFGGGPRPGDGGPTTSPSGQRPPFTGPDGHRPDGPGGPDNQRPDGSPPGGRPGGLTLITPPTK